jgi:hypothetical protein
LREKLIANLISRDEQRTYKEDGRDDDDNGRKQQENEAHGNPRRLDFVSLTKIQPYRKARANF